MNMREMLAKAMAIHDGGPESAFDLWLGHVDAALAALHDPTPEMIEAARTAWLESASDYTRLTESIAAAFTAAIAAAKDGA